MGHDFHPFKGTGAGTSMQDLSELEFFVSRPVMTTEAFDRMAFGRKPDQIIWTLGAIARRIGTGQDFVRDTLANVDGSPVREVGGRFFAFEDELIAFLRSDRTKPSKPL